MRSALRLLSVLLAVGLPATPVIAQDSPSSKQKVNSLIQKLDSDSFAERKGAFADLKSLGLTIVPYLSEARNTVESEEVRSRLDSLLSLQRLPTAVLRGHSDRIMGVAFAPDSSKLVSVSTDRTLRIWDLNDKESLYQSPPMRTPLETAIFNRDGNQMVVCGGNLRGGLNELKLCSSNDGQEIHSFLGHVGRVNRLSLSPDGNVLVSSGIDKTIKAWDVATGKNLVSLRGHTAHVYGVSFHPDGERLASCGRDNTVRVWDLSLGNQIQLLEGHTDQVIDVAFSPDGNHLASACDDKTIRFWDVSSGKELRRFLGHQNAIRALSFSPDSRLLASASYDETVKVWEVSTGTCIATLGHKDVARSVTFSPNGKFLASACGDHTICIWDTSTFIDLRTDAGVQQSTKEYEFKDGILVCEVGPERGEGAVKLYQGDNIVWRIGGLSNPEFAEQLPNGHVLIAEHGYEPKPELLRVTERTPDNKIVWTHDAYEPVACFRLDDGRTVVAAERSVYIVDRDGKKTKELYSRPRNLVRGAGLLPDNTIGFFQTAFNSSLFVEIDVEGNVQRETEIENDGMGFFATLPNGHLLLPMTFDNKVIELDVNRKPIGEFATNLRRPCGVQRLLGGDVAVTWEEGVTTFDSKGNKIGEQFFAGDINAVRIYTSGKFNIKLDSAISDFELLKNDPAVALEYVKELGATVDDGGTKNLVSEIDLYRFYPAQSLVNDESLRVIGLFSQLEKLNLANTRISDQGVVHLKTLANLRELNLDRTGITDRGLATLATIQSLNRVSLVDVSIGDEGLKALVESNPHLEHVDIAGTKVSDTGLACLAGLKNLKTVALPHDCSDQGLLAVSKISSLESVSVSSGRLTSKGVKSLADLGNLESLELTTTKLTDEAVDAIIGIRGLRHLDLSGSKLLTPTSLKKLSKLRKLRILKLDDCQVTDEVLEHIATLGYLEELFLQGTSVTDKGLRHLGNAITLKHIYLYETPVSARAIKDLKLFELPYCRVVKRDPG